MYEVFPSSDPFDYVRLFSSYFIIFLSLNSISFIFNYLSICFPFNFISYSSSEFRLKRLLEESSDSAVRYRSLLLCVAYRLSRGNFSSNVFERDALLLDLYLQRGFLRRATAN